MRFKPCLTVIFAVHLSGCATTHQVRMPEASKMDSFWKDGQTVTNVRFRDGAEIGIASTKADLMNALQSNSFHEIDATATSVTVSPSLADFLTFRFTPSGTVEEISVWGGF